MRDMDWPSSVPEIFVTTGSVPVNGKFSPSSESMNVPVLSCVVNTALMFPGVKQGVPNGVFTSQVAVTTHVCVVSA